MEGISLTGHLSRGNAFESRGLFAAEINTQSVCKTCVFVMFRVKKAHHHHRLVRNAMWSVSQTGRAGGCAQLTRWHVKTVSLSEKKREELKHAHRHTHTHTPSTTTFIQEAPSAHSGNS